MLHRGLDYKHTPLFKQNAIIEADFFKDHARFRVDGTEAKSLLEGTQKDGTRRSNGGQIKAAHAILFPDLYHGANLASEMSQNSIIGKDVEEHP